MEPEQIDRSDIYKNPPKNKEEVAGYLLASLKSINMEENTHTHTHIYNDKIWIQIYGFRRAYQIHGVYVNKETNEHAFHVDECEWVSDTEPNFGVWKSFDDMIDGVSSRYAKLWRL
jgi:hypothetical protein